MMRSTAQLEDALDRALAAADVTSSAAWRDEHPIAYTYTPADADVPGGFAETRNQAALSRVAFAAKTAWEDAPVPASGAPPGKSGAVGAQLDAALREVTAVLRRGRAAHEGAHEPVRLLAVRAAAAGAEQRAAATAARALATRSDALRRRGQLLEEEQSTAAAPEPGHWRWQERRLDEGGAAAPYQLAAAPHAEPARRAPVAPPPGARSESRASHSRDGLAHAAGARRLHAIAAQHGAAAHNALLRRTARVAAAWDDDDE